VVNFNAYSGRPCLVVINHYKLSTKVRKLFFNEFNGLIESINGFFHYRESLVDGSISIVTKHLLSIGGKASQFYTQVIDLEIEEVELKRSIRKSFKSLINWGFRELNFVIKTSKDINFEDIQLFRELHYIESGKRTRHLFF